MRNCLDEAAWEQLPEPARSKWAARAKLLQEQRRSAGAAEGEGGAAPGGAGVTPCVPCDYKLGDDLGWGI